MSKRIQNLSVTLAGVFGLMSLVACGGNATTPAGSTTGSRFAHANRGERADVTHRLLPRSIGQELVRGKISTGSAFVIAERRVRYKQLTTFDANVYVEDANRWASGNSTSQLTAGPLKFGIYTGCVPHPYVIVFGLLDKNKDTVLVRVRDRLVRLRHVTVPQYLSSGGSLVYSVFAVRPTELVIRAADGAPLKDHLLESPSQACRQKGSTIEVGG